MRNLLFLLAFVFVQATALAQAIPFRNKFSSVEKYIDTLMKEWNIPGLALAIVYEDQLIYAKGFGYRDLEKKLPVDANTIFPIASNTKLFTATAAAMLQVEGRLSLDVPVKTYMPGLNFSTAQLNSEVTLRDMLSHRTGLPRYDAIWVASQMSRSETISKVVYMKPTLGFRQGYIYNNMMFAAAGAVMEKVTDQTWENLVRTRIFQPLGMQSSCFTNEEMKAGGNYANAYFQPDSSRKLSLLEFSGQSIALGPAGTIKSNLTDMGKWMIAQLNEGRYKGQQVIPAAAIKLTLVPNSIADREGRWPELSNSLYGLGRIIQTYKGYKIAMHTGSIDGFYSNLTFIPSEKLAVFVVHNGMPGGSIRSMMALPVIDRLLLLSFTPWSVRYREDYLSELKDEKRFKDSLNKTRVEGTSPSHPLNDYAGNYSNPVYGDFVIEHRNNQLLINYRGLQSELHHFHYDQFVTDEEATGKPEFRLAFLTSANGKIDRFSINLFGDPVAEFVKK